LATVDCRQCDETLGTLKKAQWAIYEVRIRLCKSNDHLRHLTAWIKETLSERGRYIPIPDAEDLARSYPMIGTTPEPEKPNT